MLLNYVIQRIAKSQKQQLPPDVEPKPQPANVQGGSDELKRRREQLQPRKQLQPGREEPTSRAQRPAERIKRARPVSGEPVEVREARAARATRSEVSTVPTITARRLPGMRALLADRRNLRQAIVIMTVLGPSRAQRPPEVG
jgi:hypothetical protein